MRSPGFWNPCYIFRKPPPHPVLAAHRDRLAGRDFRQPLAELDFVAVDTELTGFDAKKDAIVSIGAVRISNMGILAGDVFHTLVRPPAGVSRTSSLIHGLTSAQLADAPPLEASLAAFIEYCGPAVLVGHHADLDMGFLNAAARRHFGGDLSAPCIDTLRLAQVHEEKRLTFTGSAAAAEHVGFSLPALCRRYGLPLFPAHNAVGDALQTAYLFLYLAKKLAQGRPMTLAGLWRAGRLWWRV